MLQNKKISISIPTYNRAEFLDRSLEFHIPLVKKYGIAIYVSDNASPDETKSVVAKWQKEYDLLFYHENAQNLGPDENIEVALKLPESDYVWILGDSNCFDQKSLELVVESLNSELDVVVVDDNYRVNNKEARIYTEHNELLSDLGWHMTQLSSLIVSKNIMQSIDFKLYSDSRFTHVGAVFGYLADFVTFNVLWLGDATVKPIMLDSIRKVSWQNITFDIWLKSWPQLILSLPHIYSLDSKLRAISDHNNKTSVFSFKNLLLLKMYGFYTTQIMKEYHQILRISFNCRKIFAIYIPLFIPTFIINLAFKIKRAVSYDE
ncbi:glycosyltransferase family 2 protein [Thiomicrospira sp. S5]|uniref:glycosyltransferase family 2 protein n=1 Tax=Thiomicrospira sp. S5 TaxID=1803865 RepID=UPI000F8A0022|nr:glycosyltransferase [Thiomicrospira sp. S5]AZR81692.1 hypothetical protein AYJ59_04980 [Thiomicrospira sp. S5]